MTNEKARDFFSAYYEGNLEPGLSVSFEQKLRADGDLKGDYEAFVRAMDSLDVLKFEEIEIPHDLHERISARLDLNIYERKRSAAPVWSTWLRGLAFAGVGALAIAGAIFAIGRTGSDSASADIVPPMPAKDRIGYTVSNEGVTLEFTPVSPKTVVITDAQGKEMNRSLVGDATTPKLKTLLANPLSTASVFGIQIGTDSLSYVAIPGKVRSSIKSGEGTVVDLAKAIADFYRVPVSLQSRVANERASWTFSSSDVVGESSKALGSTYSVTLLQKGNGILEIEQK